GGRGRGLRRSRWNRRARPRPQRRDLRIDRRARTGAVPDRADPARGRAHAVDPGHPGRGERGTNPPPRANPRGRLRHVGGRRVKTLRLIWVGWKFHVKSLTLSGFFILTSVLQPIIFASVAYFLFRAGAREGPLLYVALGAGMMGIWSSTLFGSGGAIQWQRWQGTLELLVAAPAPFVFCLLPLTVATSSVGLYSLVAPPV